MKRFDKRYIFYHLFTDFFLSLFIVFAFAAEILFEEDEMGEIIGFSPEFIPILIIAVLGFYAVFSIYRILYYRFSGYCLSENEICCKRGVLFRKKSIIDYKKIHALNKKQNIFHKLFGIAVLTVDSGSANTGHTAEITVVERSAVVDSLLLELHALREGGERKVDGVKAPEVVLTEGDPLYKFATPKKFLYSLISIATTAFFTGAYLLVSILLIGICKEILKLDFLGTLGQYAMWAIIILLGAMILVSVFTFIGAVIQSFIGYYNFKIEKRDNDIIISYGLLERHTNSFSYDRIRGVKITQGLIQRALGFAEIRLEVIGYTVDAGNDSSVMLGVLVPFCKYSEIPEILDKILPEYKPTERQTESPRLFPHLSWFTLILATICALVAMSAAVPMAILGVDAYIIGIVLSFIGSTALIIFLSKLVSALLAYKTAGFAIDGEKLTAYGGGYIKQITVMKRRDLSSVEAITTPMQKKAGIASAILHMRTNAMTNEVKVAVQDAETLKSITAFMDK